MSQYDVTYLFDTLILYPLISLTKWLSLPYTVLPNHAFLLQQLIAASVCSLLVNIRYSNCCRCWPSIVLEFFPLLGVQHYYSEQNNRFTQNFSGILHGGRNTSYSVVSPSTLTPPLVEPYGTTMLSQNP